MGSIVSSRFLVALKATGMSTLKIDGIVVALKATVTEEGKWRITRKENPKCGGPTFLTVWRTHM